MSMTKTPNGIAPTEIGTYRLGAKGGRMAVAWQYIWDRINPTDWTDGLELARDAAKRYELKQVTVTEMLCRMRAAGALEQTTKTVPTTYVRYGKSFVAQRQRVHYRIASTYAAGTEAPVTAGAAYEIGLS